MFCLLAAVVLDVSFSSAEEFDQHPITELAFASPLLTRPVVTEPLPEESLPEQTSSDDLNTRIESLEKQIHWLQQNQSQKCPDVLGTLNHQLHCQSVGTGGLFFEAEASFLRPYLSGALSSATSTGGKWLDPSYGTATRLKFGYVNDSGLGFRAQYFSFNHGNDLAGTFGGGSVGLKMNVVDAEVTLKNNFRNWDLGVSGGVRYGYLGINGDGVVIFPGQLTFEGIGATASVDASRKLGNSGLTLFGSLRGSFLLGEIHNGQPVRGLSYGSVEDEIAQVIDHQMGVAWLLPTNTKAQLQVKAAWETQFWLNDTIADDVFGIGSNLALSGPSVALEVRY